MGSVEEENILTVAFMNIRGKSGLTIQKQLQIESFIKYNNCDITHLQEAHISDDTFSTCDFISSTFNIVPNNSLTKYGTASLVKAEFVVENLRYDNEGRVIVFDIGDLSLANIYLHSGTDARSKGGRENICSEILPNMLMNCKDSGFCGGDFNCIIKMNDATNNPESKMSRCLERLVKLKEWQDSYRALYPSTETYSRYYANTRAEGASRIDRCYHFGGIKVKESKYIPLAFSDHFAHVVKFILPGHLSRVLCPKARPSFRLRADVLHDIVFKSRLEEAITCWQREEINLLLLRQAYLTRKLVVHGQTGYLGELHAVHLLMDRWYNKEAEKIQHQARVNEFQDSEKSSIYHHELHKRTARKGAILKLQTEAGLITGHSACADYLEQTVEDLLLHPGQLDLVSQQILLDEVTPVFTAEDVKMFLTPPTKKDVWDTVSDSNLNAAPGIPSLAYKECWSVLGEPLTEVMQAIHSCQPLQTSMRTSLMMFGSKPKKPNSLLPKDKRRISLLNSDFKVATGLEARCFKKTATHSLAALQLVAGEDRRIHHGINFARNAIYATGEPGPPWLWDSRH